MVNTVIKRDGSVQAYDVTKIKKCIAWAVQDLDVNPLELESHLAIELKEGVGTLTIHEQCIQSSLNLVDEQTPDWKNVAGRLFSMKYIKDIRLQRELEGRNKYSLYELICDRVVDNYYDAALFSSYSKEDIDLAETWLDEQRTFDLDYAGITTLVSRYLYLDELPQELFMIVALALASKLEVDKLDMVKQIYDAISLRLISLASPILMNLRKCNGNLSSCFILAIDDNAESITDAFKDIAFISKEGGGVGVNVSNIRAMGSKVRGLENSSGGVVPFIKIINDLALAFNQGGKRAGAVTVGLDMWHLDIQAFLNLQIKEGGDSRVKAFDIFPQVIIPDIFMRRKKQGLDWTLVCPYEVKQVLGIDLVNCHSTDFEEKYLEVEANKDKLKLVNVVSAKELWKTILKRQHETGLPYLFFKDTANKHNPNKDSGVILQSNLCVTGDTLLLTKEGNIPIEKLAKETESIEVWNGEGWSKTKAIKTSENEQIYEVHLWNYNFTEYNVIYCTGYHKFYVQTSEGEEREKRALFLKNGDALIETKYPDKTSKFWQVFDVIPTDRFEDVYCVHEPFRNKVVFNGVLTGNCVESYSNIEPDKYTHCCNLVSINLSQVTEDYYISSLAKLAVNILEQAVDLTAPPIPEAKAHNDYYRTIGVGFMGLADWLAYRNLNYYTGKEQAKDLFDRFSYHCVEASMELAKEKGTFGAYDKSEWKKGNLLGRPLQWFLDNSAYADKWLALSEQIKEHGIRHSQLMAIAPNTASSLLQGCTASILPPYNIFFFDKNRYGKFPVIPPYYKDKSWFYTANTTQDQKVLVDFIANAIVPYVDSGISMELNFNHNLGYGKPKYVSETLDLAWELECKTVYYVRGITKKDTECLSCAN